MCKAIDKNSVCCLPTYPRKLVASFKILDRFFQLFFTWIISGARLVTFSAGPLYCFG